MYSSGHSLGILLRDNDTNNNVYNIRNKFNKDIIYYSILFIYLSVNNALLHLLLSQKGLSLDFEILHGLLSNSDS